MTPPTQPPAQVGPLAVLAFFAEVAMLVGLGIVGWHVTDTTLLSVALALALQAVAAAVWGLWCAPRAWRRLPMAPRWVVKVALATATFALLVVVVGSRGAVVLGLAQWVALLLSLPADRDR